MRPRGIALTLTSLLLFSSFPIVGQQNQRTKEQQERAKREEAGSVLKKWPQEEVAYIITGEEEDSFKRLSTDAEREVFIEQFWLRRDQTPDTADNEYRDDYYRRIA